MAEEILEEGLIYEWRNLKDVLVPNTLIMTEELRDCFRYWKEEDANLNGNGMQRMHNATDGKSYWWMDGPGLSKEITRFTTDDGNGNKPLYSFANNSEVIDGVDNLRGDVIDAVIDNIYESGGYTAEEISISEAATLGAVSILGLAASGALIGGAATSWSGPFAALGAVIGAIIGLAVGIIVYFWGAETWESTEFKGRNGLNKDIKGTSAVLCRILGKTSTGSNDNQIFIERNWYWNTSFINTSINKPIPGNIVLYANGDPKAIRSDGKIRYADLEKSDLGLYDLIAIRLLTENLKDLLKESTSGWFGLDNNVRKHDTTVDGDLWKRFIDLITEGTGKIWNFGSGGGLNDKKETSYTSFGGLQGWLNKFDNAISNATRYKLADIEWLRLTTLNNLGYREVNDKGMVSGYNNNVVNGLTALKDLLNEIEKDIRKDIQDGTAKKQTLEENYLIDADSAKINALKVIVDSMKRNIESIGDILINNDVINGKIEYIEVKDFESIVNDINSLLIKLAENYARFEIYIEELSELFINDLNLRKDHDILWIDTISHMLLTISTENLLYYSDPGESTESGIEIPSLNFYSAEYANSDFREIYRLANRVLCVTNNTIEFWDITNDYEDPLSPAYASNVFTLETIPGSCIIFNDTCYCIARQDNLSSFGIYRITKQGQIEKISYPQLDVWMNDPAVLTKTNLNNNNTRVRGSVWQFETCPIISWNFRDHLDKLCYNATANAFFYNSDMNFYAFDRYFKYNDRRIGELDAYAVWDPVSRTQQSVHAKLVTVNTNFGGKSRPVKNLIVDCEIDLDKNNVKWCSCCVKDMGNRYPFSIWHKIARVSNLQFNSLREVLIGGEYKGNGLPVQTKYPGKRNIIYKVVGLGLGTDFQTEMSWNGYFRINKLKYEVE
jgi:hypothetical protein